MLMILKWHGEKSNDEYGNYLVIHITRSYVQNLTYNIDDQLDAWIAKFTHMCINHHNDVCRSISYLNSCVKTQHLLQTLDI